MQGVLTAMMVLTVALFLPGVIVRTRAVLAGRRGAGFFQHVRNLNAMLRKGVVVGHTSTLIFRTAPAVYTGTLFTALLFVPVGSMGSLLHFNGDVVMFAYILALSRLAIILAALDTGISFEGMGASREALYGAMIEPAIFVVAGTLALVSGFTSFSEIFRAIVARQFTPEMVIVMLFLGYVITKILTVECCRVPFDDPRTHLELTMIHEGMILDYSGADLAIITAGSWIKMGILAVLAADTVAALFTGGWLSVPLSFGLALAVGAMTGTIESLVSRNRLARNTTYIATIVAIAFILFTVAYILTRNIPL